MRALHLLASGVLLCVTCRAQAVYTYVGNNFTAVSGIVTTSNRISVSLSFPLPLPANIGNYSEYPSAWTMSDGINTFSSGASSSGISVEISTDAAGNVVDWFISATGMSSSGAAVLMETIKLNFQQPRDDTRYVDINGNILGTGENDSEPGKWGTTACHYSLSATGQAFPASGGSGSIGITAPSGCSWTVAGAPNWVTFLGSSSGSGGGTVNYQVVPNTGNTARTVTMTVAGLPFALSQATVGGGFYIGSMPHLAAEGGWSTTFTLINKGSAPEQANLSLFDPSGNPLPLPLAFPQSGTSTTESMLNQALASNALFLAEASGPANVQYLEGSAQLAGSADVDGFAIFHFDPSGQEAVVPMEMRNAPSYFLPFDDTNGVLTGIAIENVSSSAQTVPVKVYDDGGAPIMMAQVPLPANGHTSFVLSNNYPMTANIRGTVEIDTPSGAQMSVLGIRVTPPGTLTTIPALANVTNVGGSMAHIASGAGWQTTFVLANTGTNAAPVNLNFFDDNGNPLLLPLTFTQTGATSIASSVTQNIGDGGTLWIQSTGPLTSALLTGSAQLTTTGNIGGYAIFRYTPNGQEAVVPLENRNASGYLLAFDNTNGIATGVAISAISTQHVSVPAVLRDDTGTQIGATSILLTPNGHSSQMLTTLFPAAAGIRGTVEFDTPAGAQISVLGIRSPPVLTFTTLPALAR